jgi:hypothetical protein
VGAVYKQTPGQMNLVFRQGDEIGTVVDFDGVSLSGHTVSAAVSSLVTGQEVLPITTTFVDAAAGRVNVSLTESQTASLPVGTYGWTLEWVAPGSVKRTALSGIVEVTS